MPMKKRRLVGLVSAALIIGILIILAYNENSVNINPSYRTSAMKDMFLKHREGNAVKWELTSSGATLPEDRKKIFLKDLSLKIRQDPEINLTSGTGIYEIEQEQVTLEDSVNMHIRDADFNTDTLHWDSRKGTIDTDNKIVFSGRKFQITGAGLLALVDKQQVRIIHDVKAVFYR